MITVYKTNVNQVDAESYKKFTESLNLYSLICPKCKHHDFQKHGYYTRKVKYRKHSVTLRILCVKYMNCKSTHALILYFYCSLLSLYAQPSSNISRTPIIVVLFCIQKPPFTTDKLSY